MNRQGCRMAGSFAASDRIRLVADDGRAAGLPRTATCWPAGRACVLRYGNGSGSPHHRRRAVPAIRDAGGIPAKAYLSITQHSKVSRQ